MKKTLANAVYWVLRVLAVIFWLACAEAAIALLAFIPDPEAHLSYWNRFAGIHCVIMILAICMAGIVGIENLYFWAKQNRE